MPGNVMGLALLANVMMAAHFGFVVLVAAGGFLALRWRWVLVPHVISVLWGMLPLNWCPLTEVQNWARVQAGGQELSGSGFVDHYFVGVVFPASHQDIVHAALAAVVLLSWLAVWLRWRRRFDVKNQGASLTRRVNRPRSAPAPRHRGCCR